MQGKIVHLHTLIDCLTFDPTRYRLVPTFGDNTIRRFPKNTASMQPGERIIVMTPGGGGWGPLGKESESKQHERQDPKHGWRGGSVAARQAEAEASA